MLRNSLRWAKNPRLTWSTHKEYTTSFRNLLFSSTRLCAFYRIPKHVTMSAIKCTMLAEKHPHPRDAKVTFEAETHSYFIDGVKAKGSVTKIVSAPFRPFDPDGVIGNMTFREGKRTTGKYAGMTEEEIRAAWDKARDDGTKMHENIECLLNDVAPEDGFNSSEECRQFLCFVQSELKSKKLIPYRTEQILYTDCGTVAGSCDLQAYDTKQKRVVLFDWKRCDEVENTSRWGFGNRPVSHLSDCKFTKYALQLNMYKLILERYYDVKVREENGMGIVALHPSNDNYTLLWVPDMQREAAKLLDDFIALYNPRSPMSDASLGAGGEETKKRKEPERPSKTIFLIDFETTGLSVTVDEITQLCVQVYVYDGYNAHKVASFSSNVKPALRISEGAAAVTGLTNEMLAMAPEFNTVGQAMIDFIDHYASSAASYKDVVIAAHNGVRFDFPLLFNRLGHSTVTNYRSCFRNFSFFDTLVALKEYPGVIDARGVGVGKTGASKALGNCYQRGFGNPIPKAHDATGDVEAMADLLFDKEHRERQPEWQYVLDCMLNGKHARKAKPGDNGVFTMEF